MKKPNSVTKLLAAGVLLSTVTSAPAFAKGHGIAICLGPLCGRIVVNAVPGDPPAAKHLELVHKLLQDAKEQCEGVEHENCDSVNNLLDITSAIMK